MKKVFFVLMMAATVLVFSCKKANDPKKPATDPSKDAPETTSDDPAKPEDKAKPVAITIDGNFSDWDAITEDVVKDNEYVGIFKGTAEDAILVAKASSDADNIYVYAEILIEALPQNSICEGWGDSMNGSPGWDGDEENDKVPESIPPFNLFIDPDANAATGFFTYAAADSDDPAIPGLGCEMCCQNLFFFNPSTQHLGVCWNQTNIGPTKIGNLVEDTLVVDENGYTGDYDYNGTIFQSWPDSGAEAAFPLWGWQNFANDKTGDNIGPRPENIADAVKGDYIVVEFAIEKSDIVNLPDDATEYAWGICFRYGDYTQDVGPVSATYAE